MIIIGYQGIGKSSLASNTFNDYIDLESSNFFYEKNGMMIRDPDWYIPYCKIANHLSEQGFNVFVSSHKVVRDELKSKSNQRILAVCPAFNLEELWINRLLERYKRTGLDKDAKALANAEARYEENIKEIIEDIGKDNTIVIENINYDLEDVISEFIGDELLAKAMEEVDYEA